MTERERILLEMVDKIEDAAQDAFWNEDRELDPGELAEICLRVVERKPDTVSVAYTGICNCGQSGYPENSPHSNHPHEKGCPQYTGLYS